MLYLPWPSASNLASSNVSDILFWLPQVPGSHMVHTHIQAKHSYTALVDTDDDQNTTLPLPLQLLLEAGRMSLPQHPQMLLFYSIHSRFSWGFINCSLGTSCMDSFLLQYDINHTNSSFQKCLTTPSRLNLSFTYVYDLGTQRETSRLHSIFLIAYSLAWLNIPFWNYISTKTSKS